MPEWSAVNNFALRLRGAARINPETSWRILFDCLLLAFAGLFLWRVVEGGAFPYSWHWEKIPSYLLRLLPEGFWWERLRPGLLSRGFFMTVQVSLWAFAVAGIFGLFFGLCRAWRRPLGRMLGATYVHSVRNIPPLVLVFVVHYFLTGQMGNTLNWDWTEWMPLLPAPGQMPVFCSAVLALGIYEGAYLAEIIRGGIESVAKGQWEAGLSLGLSRERCLYGIILPQAGRAMLPPLTGQCVSLIKDSSIVSMIAVQELTLEGANIINSSGMIFEVWISVTVLYLLLCLSVSFIGRQLEKKRGWNF